VSTTLLVMSWTMLLCSVLHMIGLIAGKVSRTTNLVGFGVLFLGGALCNLLQWAGDKLVFDVLHFINSPTAGAVFLAFRVITLLVAIIPVLKLAKMTWKRAFIVGGFEREDADSTP